MGARAGSAVSPRFRAISIAFIPEVATLGDDDWLEVEAIVERALAARPAKVRRQLALFTRLLDVIAFAHTGHTISGLSPHQRWRLLDELSKSPLLPIRRGVWGLRTLVFMGYYARPNVAAEIGYRAEPAGWTARKRSAGS